MPDQTTYSYNRIFDPEDNRHIPVESGREPGDHRKTPAYVYTEEIVLAVNVALATRRPLLVRGASGSGKSSLAANAADYLGRRYYDRVITSRTQASDLLWEVDLLRRLHEAMARDGKLSEDYTPYIVPGALWWAFSPNTAKWRGGDPNSVTEVMDPSRERKSEKAVVLLDEIDKADPDVPNNLLVPLGSLQFQVAETDVTVSTTVKNAPLVFITTNEERELPDAFLRRCVEVELPLPSRSRMIEIGKAHFPEETEAEICRVLDAVPLKKKPKSSEEPLGISPAEFLDTFRARKTLEVEIDGVEWGRLLGITLDKKSRAAESGR